MICNICRSDNMQQEEKDVQQTLSGTTWIAYRCMNCGRKKSMVVDNENRS